MTFAPQHNGVYTVCLTQGVRQFSNPPEYGEDITAKVLHSTGASMDYSITGKRPPMSLTHLLSAADRQERPAVLFSQLNLPPLRPSRMYVNAAAQMTAHDLCMQGPLWEMRYRQRLHPSGRTALCSCLPPLWSLRRAAAWH